MKFGSIVARSSLVCTMATAIGITRSSLLRLYTGSFRSLENCPNLKTVRLKNSGVDRKL